MINPAVQCVRRCDCGQQSTSQSQSVSAGLMCYAAVGTSEATRPLNGRCTCKGPRAIPGAFAVS